MQENSSKSKLVDFSGLRTIIIQERAAYIKANTFSEDDPHIRSIEDATLILDFLEITQKSLHDFFELYNSLQEIFEKDFGDFGEFIHLEAVLSILFYDEFLFPEKELFSLVVEGRVTKELMDSYAFTFQDWMREKKAAHEASKEQIEKKRTFDLKSADLPCQCIDCISLYRTKIREDAFDECTQYVTEYYADLAAAGSLRDRGELFADLKKKIDAVLYKIRFRVKRSSLTKLESQVKSLLKDKFYYPSELGNSQAQLLTLFFKQELRKQGLRQDLLSEEDFDKYYKQLGSNLWRTEGFLEREFKKYLNSILLLKRKDISATILTEYLGTFWVHARARRINRTIIYHMGPTNSGKTYHAIDALAKVKKGCYLAPLRLLAAELYDTLNSKGVVTTLLTGEEVIELPDATHYSSTIEMAKLSEDFDCCVIDEIQMISDPQRGWAWTRALVNICSPEIHVCGDSSVLELIERIITLTGDKIVVKDYERMTELKVEPQPITLADMERSDALIVFSRRNALKFKADLEQLNYKVSIVYGRLSPEVRREQARKFDQGETDIIVATDAISMGMNLPIRRIIFSTLKKYVENQEQLLTDSEIKQIAGRCGRFNRFPVGYVTCLSKEEGGLERIRESLKITLPQKTKTMVGPDLEIFAQVNDALKVNSLPELKLSEFLRLFNTMKFEHPFYCVDLREMIELAEMVEDANQKNILSNAEIFGFACAPVNQNDSGHVQYYVWMLNKYANSLQIDNEEIDTKSSDIDYLETAIKCVELYQWLARHFKNKNFSYVQEALIHNKAKAIERLNELLSEKTVKTCASCAAKLSPSSRFNICDDCFKKRHQRYSPRRDDGPRDRAPQSGGERSRSSSRGRRPASKSKGAKFRR